MKESPQFEDAQTLSSYSFLHTPRGTGTGARGERHTIIIISMQGRVHFDYIIGGSGVGTLEPWNLGNPGNLGKLGKLEDFMGRRTLGSKR